MSYRVRFRRSAKAELRSCCEVYTCMVEPLSQWLDELAGDAAGGDHEVSVSIEALLSGLVETGDQSPLTLSAWQLFRERFTRLGLVGKIKALLVLLRRRRPPWEVRAAVRVFQVLGTFHSEVAVVYEVNHPDRELVVTKWEGLPGQ